MFPRIIPRGQRIRRLFSTDTKTYEYVLVEQKGAVGIITLHRPKALNALCDGLLADLVAAATVFDKDDSIGAIIITGSKKAFAAGADIKEMSTKTFAECYYSNLFKNWTDVTKIVKPTIAAVSGYALGGGCELAMMCDMIIASESAKFGQPEISLGIIPGCGGTQRLIRAIGKSKAMEMILTGKMIDAAQAERDGMLFIMNTSYRIIICHTHSDRTRMSCCAR
jgi:enoyl-CoA hydratase/carnithine racemase